MVGVMIRSTALGVSAPDPKTVRIELTHPAPYLLELTKHQSFFPVPRHAVEKYGDGWVQPGRYVSNGPFMLVRWRLGDRIIRSLPDIEQLKKKPDNAVSVDDDTLPGDAVPVQPQQEGGPVKLPQISPPTGT